MKSIFNRFFVIEEGVISVSLKDLTPITTITLSIAMIVMLYQGCNNNYVRCSRHLLPMVSDVICIPGYDRMFVFLTTFYMMGVHQCNIRAFYKKLNGVSSTCTNDMLLVFGILTCIGLPAAALLDEHIMGPHVAWAAIFFISNSFYCFLLS